MTGRAVDGVVESGVGGQAAGPGDVAEAAQVAGLVGGQHGGAGEPVVDDAVAAGRERRSRRGRRRSTAALRGRADVQHERRRGGWRRAAAGAR